MKELKLPASKGFYGQLLQKVLLEQPIWVGNEFQAERYWELVTMLSAPL